MRSIWKATYFVMDAFDNQNIKVQEENAWVKIIDGFFTEIPILGILQVIFQSYLYRS